MRKLTLKTEHLSELSSAELTAVQGGQEIPKSLPCLTGVYPTINYDCVGFVTSFLPPTN